MESWYYQRGLLLRWDHRASWRPRRLCRFALFKLLHDYNRIGKIKESV